jgi:YHS domain-containing protein
MFLSFILNLLEQFKYTVLETENSEEDIDEEEEEVENEDEEGNEEEEEEVDLFKRDRKKHLGDTSIYDPVALFEKNILLPGKTDFILSYNSKTYRFANEDNRSAFLQAPLKYLPIHKPPTVLIFILNDFFIRLFVFISYLHYGLFLLERKVLVKVYMDEN